MRILFYMGMVLIAMALLAAAVETGARGLSGTGQDFFMSARDLWYALRPKSLLVFEIRLDRIAPWLWNPVMMTILTAPAWAVFGLPGGLFVWLSHNRRGDESDEEIQEALDQFRLFDDLTREALKENPRGEEHGPRDMLPDDLIGQDIAPDANAPGEFIADDVFTENIPGGKN